MDQRTLFNIPADNYPKFEAQIAKISRKAEKLGFSAFQAIPFSHKTVGEGENSYRVYEVLLDADAPHIEGWTFVARLDHSNETGTVIRSVPNAGDLPEEFRHADPHRCDHCHTARQRRDTFVIRNDKTGEFKQVGSTCLQDFFDGQDPMKVAKMAELLGYAYECGHAAEEYERTGLNDYRWIDLGEFLEYAASEIRRNGWVSAATARQSDKTATRDVAAHAYRSHDRRDITPEDIKLAEDAREWAISLKELPEQNDYQHNVAVIAEAMMIEHRSVGLAASIVGVFWTNKMRAEHGNREVEVGNFAGVIDLFKKAAEHLQWPKIRLSLEDGSPIVLSVAGDKSSAKGSVNITDGGSYGANVWYGRVSPDGTWMRSRHAYDKPSLTALLTALANDPAATAAAYGKLNGQCCFCNKPLTDERSTFVGYGETCASKWNLHYPKMSEVEHAR